MPLIHLHKGLYNSIYHQHPTVITFIYQAACICQVFNAPAAAAATLTFIYQLPMMSPPRIGASTTPLLLKHTQPQKLFAAAILPPQQLAASSYFIPLLPQQQLEAYIYFTATATISSCYFTIKATISSL